MTDETIIEDRNEFFCEFCNVYVPVVHTPYQTRGWIKGEEHHVTGEYFFCPEEKILRLLNSLYEDE
jgi:hypothetical protein